MNKRQGFNIGYFIMTLLVMWVFSELVYKPMIVSNTQVPYSDFLQDLKAERIDDVTLEEQRIIYTLKGGDISRLSSSVRNTVRVEDPGVVERLIEAGVTFKGVAASRSILHTIIGMLLPFIPLMLLWFFIFKKMGGQNNPMMTIGKNKAQEIQGEKTGVKFSDVGGVGEAETELREIIDFLKEPERFSSMGAKLPKGVLLVGPPGTGKTLLAKATAGEAGVTFFSMTGSSFVEMFVGVGAARVRDLFEQAKKKAPCIIFIDEIDAIGQSRASNAVPGGGNSERENTLNQLLAEMDGFQSNIGVVIMAAHYLPDADPVHKISIIPTAKGALGYTMQMPSDDQYLLGENALKSRLAVMLGGRAAELLVFGEATTGASNDLERATELARRMVTEFGMSGELGPVRYAAPVGAYLHSFAASRSDIGSDTVAAIDREIHKLIMEAQKRAQDILHEHEAVMHEVAGVLQNEEVITGTRMREIAESFEEASGV